jgi:hypothetical protein
VTVSFEQAAWSWTEHLRSGGSRPWSDWVAAGEGTGAAVPDGWTPPGAAQLEVVRRASSATGQALPAEYVDRVLARSGPARGLANLPLGWPGATEARPFGPPRTDPADVPDEELIRLGVGVLSDLLLMRAHPDENEWRVRRRLLSRSPAFELAGSPVTTAAVRRALAVAGQAEAVSASRVVLVTGPFDTALLEVWSARVQRGAPARWRGFVARAAHGLPRSIDLSRVARTWADRVGPGAVHVVVAPADLGAATRLVAEVLGIPLGSSHPRRPPTPPPLLHLTPPAVDVVRRVNAVLAVKAPEAQHARAVRQLSILLQDRSGGQRAPEGRLTVPRAFQDWAQTQAERFTDDVRRGGYPVHGELGRIVPVFDDVPTQPHRATVLRLVLEAGVGLAAAESQSPTEEELYQ